MRDGWDAAPLGKFIKQSKKKVKVQVGIEYPAIGVMMEGRGFVTRPPFVGGKTTYKQLTPIEANQLVLRSITAWEAPIQVTTEVNSGFHVSGVFPVFDIDSSMLNPKFLSLLCRYEPFWESMRERTVGSVLRRKTLSASALMEIPVQLPPLPEQKRIVDLISSVDSYLASLRNQLTKSVSARKSALEAQLEFFNQASQVFKLEELCATGKSAIVDGPFGANLKREDYLEQGIPVLKIQNIKQDFVVIKKMDYVSEEKFSQLRRHSFQKNDIIMTKLGDPLGLSAIVRELDKGLIVADLVRIRPDKINVEFLFMQLNSARIQNYINRMQKGSTRPRVNLGMIREMPIAVPSESDINKFVSVFGSWSEQIKKLEETISLTELLRSGLLSDLLSGQREIPSSYEKVIGAAYDVTD